MAVQHLINLGHRQIAYLRGTNNSQNDQARFKGYCRALSGASVGVDERLVVSAGWEFDQGAQATKELLARRVPFTAVIASSDAVAAGAMKVLVNAGMLIPKNVSIIGAGNCDFTDFFTPPITSIEQHPEVIGKRSVEILFKHIDNPNAPVVRRAITPHMIERESTCYAEERDPSILVPRSLGPNPIGKPLLNSKITHYGMLSPLPE